jgi:hypothetical protein
MKSFLPAFKKAIEIIKPVLETNNFCFSGVEERPLICTPHLKPFIEDLNANFTRGEDSVSMGCTFSQTSKFILTFSYYKPSKHIDFFISYYATDHNLAFFINHPIIQSYEEGELHISKYFDELKKLLETTLMAKINDGTIENHY